MITIPVRTTTSPPMASAGSPLSVSKQLIRMSVGIENVVDLSNDLLQVLM